VGLLQSQRSPEPDLAGEFVVSPSDAASPFEGGSEVAEVVVEVGTVAHKGWGFLRVPH
jgi:hypothetical protein